jgi:hypothetical protein
VLSHRANVHRHRLPRLGAVVRVKIRPLGSGMRWRKYRVESFPASRGLRHCANLVALDNGERCTVSGFWCEEWDG